MKKIFKVVRIDSQTQQIPDGYYMKELLHPVFKDTEDWKLDEFDSEIEAEKAISDNGREGMDYVILKMYKIPYSYE